MLLLMGVEIKNLEFGIALILKNTQRRFKINIKELTRHKAIIFKALFRGFNGIKGGVISKSPIRFKK
ncbi:hypothetical protein MM0353_00410 [Helicobacter pylori]